MPGSTSLGIPYPLQGETVDAASWQDMADTVDGLLTQLDTIRDVAVSKPSVSISGGTVVTATGVNGTVTGFTTEDWDTGGYADLGVNPDRVTVPAGIYFAVCEGSLTGFTTLTMMRLSILADGVIWGANNVDTLTGSGVFRFSWGGGTVMVSTASNAIQVRTRWNGTGGPATTQSVTLRVYKIRDLADL